MVRTEFDEAYYERFYGHAKTRVDDERSMNRLGGFVLNYLKYLELPVRNVLDLGCGLGAWKKLVRRHFPKATYQGVEVSPYLCKKYGWKQSRIGEYEDETRYDLIVCQGVLQYLDATEVRRAIRQFKSLGRAALYLQVLTAEDWYDAADQDVTDGQVYLREAAWYRKALAGFLDCGGGVFLHPMSPAVLYALEARSPK